MDVTKSVNYHRRKRIGSFSTVPNQTTLDSGCFVKHQQTEIESLKSQFSILKKRKRSLMHDVEEAHKRVSKASAEYILQAKMDYDCIKSRFDKVRTEYRNLRQIVKRSENMPFAISFMEMARELLDKRSFYRIYDQTIENLGYDEYGRNHR